MRTALNKLIDRDLIKLRGTPPATPKKYADGGGLYLLHQPNGAMLWRMKYRFAGVVEKLLSFGAYNEVTLAQARRKRDEARAILAAGGDPAETKRAAKAQARAEALGESLEPATDLPTFGRFASELLADMAAGQEKTTRAKWERHVGYAVDHFGERPIAGIRAIEIFDFLRSYQAQGKLHTMHSIKQKISAIFDRGVLAEACQGDPTTSLGSMLLPAVDEHHPAIVNPTRFGQMLKAIDGFTGSWSTRGALQLLALTFQRPHMVRDMEWAEVDWQAARWEISAAKMKGRRFRAKEHRDHVVPLCHQAMAVLRAIEPISGDGRYVFPGRAGDEPMTNPVMNQALKRLGFNGDEHVAHGFRASANTMLKEQLGFSQELIDLQMAHVIANQVRRAYDRVVLIKERTAMMQAWGDYLDTLRKAAPRVTKLRPVED
jgi:integrase